MTPPKHSLVDSQLIADLHKLSKAHPKLVKSSIYADPSITVRSWKMNEFKYYDVPSPFPTLARGIFSVELPPDEPQESKGSEHPVKYRIIARGYDKSFNIGEVPWTTVRSNRYIYFSS
jgi:tRNA ligase